MTLPNAFANGNIVFVEGDDVIRRNSGWFFFLSFLTFAR